MNDVITHRLSFAVRFTDHFSREAVQCELPVRLAGTLQRPVLRPGGNGRRQSDGAYRFVSAPGGATRILWREPFARAHAGWTRWQSDDPEVLLPLADPAALVDVELWPTANATAPASATGVRGKLVGPTTAGQTVRIAAQGQPFSRFTRSDATGDFLFLPPGRLPADASGRVPLSIEVRAPGGAVRVVVGGEFRPAAAGATFAGTNFHLAPRTVPRIVFELA
jgi:hypothetical protein